MLCKTLAFEVRYMTRDVSERYDLAQSANHARPGHAAQGFGTQNACIDQFGMNILGVSSLALYQGIHHNDRCNQKLSWNTNELIVTHPVSDMLFCTISFSRPKSSCFAAYPNDVRSRSNP